MLSWSFIVLVRTRNVYLVPYGRRCLLLQCSIVAWWAALWQACGTFTKLRKDVRMMCRLSSQASLAHTMSEEQRPPLLAAYVGN